MVTAAKIIIYAIVSFVGVCLANNDRIDCFNCVSEEKIFYRAYFPGSNQSTACVWSKAHLPAGYFVINKACTPRECDTIHLFRGEFYTEDRDCRWEKGW